MIYTAVRNSLILTSSALASVRFWLCYLVATCAFIVIRYPMVLTMKGYAFFPYSFLVVLAADVCVAAALSYVMFSLVHSFYQGTIKRLSLVIFINLVAFYFSLHLVSIGLVYLRQMMYVGNMSTVLYFSIISIYMILFQFFVFTPYVLLGKNCSLFQAVKKSFKLMMSVPLFVVVFAVFHCLHYVTIILSKNLFNYVFSYFVSSGLSEVDFGAFSYQVSLFAKQPIFMFFTAASMLFFASLYKELHKGKRLIAQ